MKNLLPASLPALALLALGGCATSGALTSTTENDGVYYSSADHTTAEARPVYDGGGYASNPGSGNAYNTPTTTPSTADNANPDYQGGSTGATGTDYYSNNYGNTYNPSGFGQTYTGPGVSSYNYSPSWVTPAPMYAVPYGYSALSYGYGYPGYYSPYTYSGFYDPFYLPWYGYRSGFSLSFGLGYGYGYGGFGGYGYPYAYGYGGYPYYGYGRSYGYGGYGGYYNRPIIYSNGARSDGRGGAILVGPRGGRGGSVLNAGGNFTNAGGASTPAGSSGRHSTGAMDPTGGLVGPGSPAGTAGGGRRGEVYAGPAQPTSLTGAASQPAGSGRINSANASFDQPARINDAAIGRPAYSTPNSNTAPNPGTAATGRDAAADASNGGGRRGGFFGGFFGNGSNANNQGQQQTRSYDQPARSYNQPQYNGGGGGRSYAQPQQQPAYSQPQRSFDQPARSYSPPQAQPSRSFEGGGRSFGGGNSGGGGSFGGGGGGGGGGRRGH